MTFDHAKKNAQKRKKIRRESWPYDFYIEIVPEEPGKRIKFQDSCGRDYGLSHADVTAIDWELFD